MQGCCAKIPSPPGQLLPTSSRKACRLLSLVLPAPPSCAGGGCGPHWGGGRRGWTGWMAPWEALFGTALSTCGSILARRGPIPLPSEDWEFLHCLFLESGAMRYCWALCEPPEAHQQHPGPLAMWQPCAWPRPPLCGGSTSPGEEPEAQRQVTRCGSSRVGPRILISPPPVL